MIRMSSFAIALVTAGLLAGPTLAQSAGNIFSDFQAQSSDPIEIDAEALEIYEEGQQRITIFDGGVEVRRGDTLIRAATVTLYAPLSGESSDTFTRIEAKGGVFVRSGGQTVTGSTAVVDSPNNRIIVAGDVVLAEGTNVISGDRLVVDMTTGRARVEQKAGERIRGVFAPGGT